MIKIITAVYIFILAGIVVLADFRQTQFIFGFIGGFPFGDKIGHFLLMGMFSVVVNLAFGAKIVKVRKFSYLLGSLIVLAIVTAEEVSQIFVSWRTFDVGDLLADAAGILIFGEIARIINRKEFNLHFSRR